MGSRIAAVITDVDPFAHVRLCYGSSMSSAAKKLESEAPSLANDPVWQAFLNAPMGPPETEEQKRMAAEALREPFTPSAVMSDEIAARCPPGK